ncbi:hypothetical protein PV396_24470 [Streptomyces sp. ME02-8801-2C]|uniref:hypothetical protein n=1 Tax=Streptomyces sp. ME02-8801-2C TaxID=3028680 RepID=UPI0029B47844|nr:hypothetical protein [Streptomyces sp. ME02-8801-2C]MDX3455057.1 hypothetical protein [Streptomyces sp. ME02-8801-2C]
MPRVNVPVTQITRAGVAAPTEVTGDATNNHVVANNGRMVLLVRNSGSTVSRTVTLRLPGLTDGQAVTPRTVSIAQSTSRYIGPFPTGDYSSLLQVDVDNAELKLLAFGV